MTPSEHDDQRPTLGAPSKPPPNYFSRGVQAKLLLMVFLFMGVLWLMSEVRKPKHWRWMWQLDGDAAGERPPAGGPATPGHRGAESGDVPRHEQIDTRVPLEPATAGAPEDPVVTGAEEVSVPPHVGREEPARPGLKMQLAGWDYVLRRLSKTQREKLRMGLWRWRRGQSFTEQTQAGWSRLVRRLDKNWGEYHSQAYQSVVRDKDVLTERQIGVKEEIIEASRALWQVRKEALRAIVSEGPIPPEQAAALTRLQQVLDQHAWARVKDNYVLRSAETPAWYRCWEQLQSLSPQESDDALGPLNFVKLYSQPSELRGRLVKVQGTVRWGYRIRSRNPRLGIEGYFVLGVLPGGGRDSPIVVYCLELPKGFPAVKLADSTGQGRMLDEDVEITGFFFKRWLHRCEGGLNLSPLILGQITQWDRHLDVHERSGGQSVSAAMVVLAVVAMAVLSMLVAVVVYRGSLWPNVGMARTNLASQELPSFDTQHVRSSVPESLQEFAAERNEDDSDAWSDG